MPSLIIEDLELWKSGKVYYVCEKQLIHKIKMINNKDHIHFSGQYRVAAHCICYWINAKPIEIPIILHNGFSHHLHLTAKYLSEKFMGNKLNC